MSTTNVGERIERALNAARMSQRGLAEQTGISQPTLSRIISGDRAIKTPEILAIAWATGTTVAALTGVGHIAERVQFVARGTNGVSMDGMRESLLHYLELDAYLEDQAIASPL